MRVFKINLAVDDFRSLLARDARVHERRLFALDGSPKLDAWTEPQEAVYDNEEAPLPDILSCEAGNMLLFGKSSSLLRPHLAPIAEFLPVVWAGQAGEVVNITRFADCLDPDRTEWCCDEDSGKRLFVERHQFVPERVPLDLPFKIKEQAFANFCAEGDNESGFRWLVESHGISGLRFDQVWEG